MHKNITKTIDPKLIELINKDRYINAKKSLI